MLRLRDSGHQVNEMLIKGRLERHLACRHSQEWFTGLSHSLRMKLQKKSNVCIQGKEKDKSGEEGKVIAEAVTPPRKCD